MDKPNMFCIIGIRHNPQLGSYLSKVKLADKIRMNKRSISATFIECGCSTTLNFSQTPNLRGEHFCNTKQHNVYGGYEYLGFSDKDKAIAKLSEWLDKNQTSAGKARDAIEQLKAIN